MLADNSHSTESWNRLPVPSKNSVAVAIQDLTSFFMRLEARLEWTVSIHAGARMGVLKAFVLFFRAMLVSRTSLAVENLALRQQLAVYKQSVKRPKLRPRDRLFWICLSRLWSNWRSALSMVQPETVIRRHRQGFQLYWSLKSRNGKPGRPPLSRDIRELIRLM